MVDIKKKRNWLAQIVAASRFSAVSEINIPILFLSSGGDQLVNPVCSEKLAQKYKATLKNHPTAGHDLPLDDPQWVSGEISKWLLTLA